MMPRCLPSFPLNPTYCSGADNNWRLSRWPEEMLFEHFQDEWHWTGMILAILNLHVAQMSPTKFGLNLTYGLGFGFKIVKMAAPINDSESLCRSNAFHQVSAQSNLRFGKRCRLKNSNMAAMAAILDIRTEWFKQFWISMSLRCLPFSFGSIRLTVWEMLF